MVERINPNIQIETFGNPINYTASNMKYWEEVSKELMKSKETGILNKAKNFLENNCIVKINGNNWKCKPIEGYNNKTYDIRLDVKGMSCNCQGFKRKALDYEQGKEDRKPICSHIVAVRQFCFLEEKEQGKIYK